MLTQDKELEIVDFEDENKLIQLIDRGRLKWPSHIVIDAIIVVWKVFVAIENEKLLMLRFYQDLHGNFNPTGNALY